MTVDDFLVKFGFKVDDKPLEKLQNSISGITTRLNFMIGAQIVHGIFELGERFSKFGGELRNAAVETGLQVEQLQSLTYAANQSAVSAEELRGGLGKLTRNLAEARAGDKGALEAFAKVGIGPDQIKGFKNSADAMAAVSDQMAQMDDSVSRQAATMALFGRGSSSMIEFLAQGSGAMRAMQKEARDVGAVVSQESVMALAELGDSLDAVGAAFKGFAGNVAGAFAPAINSAARAVLHFWASNRKLIQLTINKWVYNVTFALGVLYEAFRETIQMVLNFAKSHEGLVDFAGKLAMFVIGAMTSLGVLGKAFMAAKGLVGLLVAAFDPLRVVGVTSFRAIVIAVTALRNGLASLMLNLAVMVETAFPKLAEAFFKFSLMLRASPIGLIITALTALAVVAQALYTVFYEGKPFKESWLGQAIEFIKGLGDKALKFFGIGAVDLTANAASNMQSAMAMGGSDMAPSLMPQANSTANTNNQVEINAPVTITVPPGTDAKATQQAVKDGIADHLDRTMRQTQRSLRPAAVY